MYILALAVVLGLAAWLLTSAVRLGRPRRRWLGVGVLLVGLGAFAAMSFVGELLWFEALGFERRFWVFVLARLGTAAAGAVAAGVLALALAWRSGPHLRRRVAVAAGAGGALWGLASWRTLLLYANGATAGTTEPVFGLDAGFYLFALPFYDALVWLAIYVAAMTAIAALFVWEDGGRIRPRQLQEPQGDPWVLPIANAALGVALACAMVVALFHLLYSDWGVVQGPGWVDVHVRRPALMVTAAGFIAVAVLPLIPAFRRRAIRLLGPRLGTGRPALAAMAGVWTAMAGLALLATVAAPALLQWLVIKPNEITFEKPYIADNIELTRQGFRLHAVEERQFVPSREFDRQTVRDNRNLLSEVRLWDWRALDAVYKQFQEIRLYYEFVDVDIDRYTIGDRYRQVMVSARELAPENLPPQSQTFVNRRFKYTHGYGYTLAPVSDFTPQGLPNLLVRDIPPKAEYESLAVTRPEIYYGELTDQPVIVNTREREFDYPRGDANAYTRYQGQGGVQLSSFWRKLIYGWKFDGTPLLLSSYPTTESRIMFRRQIQRRVAAVAPFLTLDADPYLVAVDGQLYWIVDAYTRSSYYPYSEPFDSREFIEGREGTLGSRTVAHLDGANYVRNAVKVVVNAYDGATDFYVFEPEDPIIRTWQRILPELFQPREAMPAGLRAHVRYPHDFLLTQGLVYSRYHMTDPEVFYNQEDLWVRATEKHYQNVVPVDPYYVMWELPGSDEAEFGLILPFTPKNRQVLIGWIAGLSDDDNYGRFLAYKFPKEQRVLGPQQVETKIDQDSYLSGQLTLWDQQGSQVIRGNVLAIPVDDSLLYVEPIYLRAETAAYPELRLIAVMHGDELSYAETFDEALAGLYTDRPAAARRGPLGGGSLAEQAQSAFDGYLEALGQGRFDEAADKLADLREALADLVGDQPPDP
jgi:uncharacterized membrane protein (UPF0182 family)